MPILNVEMMAMMKNLDLKSAMFIKVKNGTLTKGRSGRQNVLAPSP